MSKLKTKQTSLTEHNGNIYWLIRANIKQKEMNSKVAGDVAVYKNLNTYTYGGLCVLQKMALALQ